MQNECVWPLYLQSGRMDGSILHESSADLQSLWQEAENECTAQVFWRSWSISWYYVIKFYTLRCCWRRIEVLLGNKCTEASREHQTPSPQGGKGLNSKGLLLWPRRVLPGLKSFVLSSRIETPPCCIKKKKDALAQRIKQHFKIPFSWRI